MGKASRRKGQQARAPRDPAQLPPPYAARPFEGLPGETEWVAMREIVPAATAPITATLDGQTRQATLATLLPLTWPALHRADGELLLALQTGGGSGDASRDLTAALIAAQQLEAGNALEHAPKVTAATPRLQDLLDETPLVADVRDGFDFWVAESELDGEARDSLDRANEAAAPTVRLDGAASAYWCRIGDRTYVRWVLPYAQDQATDGLARLHDDGRSTLDGGRLLGAFRACGLLIPVWEVEPERDPASLNEPMTAMVTALEEAVAVTDPLTSGQRRARSGVVSRQITLR